MNHLYVAARKGVLPKVPPFVIEQTMLPQESTWVNNLIDLAKIISPAILAIAAGYIGYRYSLAHLRRQKQLDFMEKQLREFYSPMLGCLERIQAKSNLRFEISKASDPAWREIVASHPKPFLNHEQFFEPFKRSIDYDNKQFRQELLPLYDKMLDIFTANIALAYSSTRDWYYEFTKFVELWHRWLEEAMPQEVLQKIRLDEERLKPFYLDLANQSSNLRKRLSSQS